MYVHPAGAVDFANARDEASLRAIADFRAFEGTLKTEPRLALPSEVVHWLVNVDKWNNIPIPLVRSTEAFKQCFDLTGALLAEVLRQQRERFEAVAGHFRLLEESAVEYQAATRRRAEQERRV